MGNRQIDKGRRVAWPPGFSHDVISLLSPPERFLSYQLRDKVANQENQDCNEDSLVCLPGACTQR